MQKTYIFLIKVKAAQYFIILLLVTLTGYSNGSYARDSNANTGFVTLKEHEKLKHEMADLKKQMQAIIKKNPGAMSDTPASVKTSTGANSKVNAKQASSTTKQKLKQNGASAANNTEHADANGGISLAEGDREKEAVEAKRQLDVFLRGQKLLFKQGELQAELDLVYSKSSSGNQFFNTTASTLPIDANRLVGANAIARYGLFDNVEFDLNLPFSYAEIDSFPNVYLGEKANHRERTGLGNINTGLRYSAWREDGTLPDIILSVNSTAPTGDGILGSNLWGVGTSMTMVKTLDPVVLFGSLGYATSIGQSGSDMLPYSLGMGFSLNDRVSFSMSMSGTAGLERSNGATLKADSNNKIIVDKAFAYSSPDINTMQFSSTIQMKKNLSVEPFVSFGLTKESPDFALGIRLPYRFEGKFPSF